MKKTRSKLWLLYEIPLGVVLYCGTLYAMYYVMTRHMDTSTQAALSLLAPVFLVMTPAMIGGYRISYQRHYSDKPISAARSGKAKKGFGFTVLKHVLLTIVCVFACWMSLAYIFRGNMAVGLSLAAVAVASSVILGVGMKRFIDRFMDSL